MSKILNFTFFSSEEPVPEEKSNRQFNTLNILKQLSKIEKYIPTIQKNIGGNDTIFSFDRRAIGKEIHFSPRELAVSFALDGTHNVKKIIGQVGTPELEVLVILLRFIKNKAASKILSHSPLSEKRRNEYLQPLKELLAEVTGPVAPVIISQSLEAIEGGESALAFSDLPLLYATVSYHLEEDEREELAEYAKKDPIWTEIISF
jgi:hypothetical protein